MENQELITCIAKTNERICVLENQLETLQKQIAELKNRTDSHGKRIDAIYDNQQTRDVQVGTGLQEIGQKIKELGNLLKARIEALENKTIADKCCDILRKEEEDKKTRIKCKIAVRVVDAVAFKIPIYADYSDVLPPCQYKIISPRDPGTRKLQFFYEDGFLKPEHWYLPTILFN